MESDPKNINLLTKILPDDKPLTYTENLEKINNSQIIDGQASLIAAGLIKPQEKVLLKDFVTNEMIDCNELLRRIKENKDNQYNHPYDEMAEKACIQFPHCKEEILNFFEHERLRNQQEQQDKLRQMGGMATSWSAGRSMQWAQFWQGIKELELDRHNEESQKKKEARNVRKGKPTGPKPVKFNGPTMHRVPRKSK